MGDQAEECDTSSGSDRAQLVLTQFGVLRKILANLPARDLGRAALVSHAWNNVCRIIRRERQSIHWFEWFSPHVNGKWTRTSPRSKINEEMGRVYCVPQVCLFFSSETINSIVYEDEERTEMELKRCRSRPSCHCLTSSEGLPHVIGHILKMMPTTCTTLGLRAFGTVGTSWDMSNTVELRAKTSLSVLMFPNIPGVHIMPFMVQKEAFMRVKSSKLLSDEELEELTGISPKEEIRCLIVFCDSFDGEEAAEVIIQNLLERTNNKMAVGGGIGDQFFTSTTHSSPILTGLAISGVSVQALSAVIPENITKEVKIRETFEQLKSCDLPMENCVGFMFSCMGRRVGRPNKEKGMESTLFRQYFPTVPLIGFFGSGEIGFNFILPSDKQDKPSLVDVANTEQPKIKKHKLNKTELMHQYSTVFVLASLRRGQ